MELNSNFNLSQMTETEWDQLFLKLQDQLETIIKHVPEWDKKSYQQQINLLSTVANFWSLIRRNDQQALIRKEKIKNLAEEFMDKFYSVPLSISKERRIVYDSLKPSFNNFKLIHQKILLAELTIDKFHKVHGGNFMDIMQTRNRDLREKIYWDFHQYLLSQVEIIAASLRGFKHGMAVEAELKDFESSLKMAFHENDIPYNHYHFIKEKILENIPHFQHSLAKRAQKLSLPELRLFDRIAHSPGPSKVTFSVEKAIHLILHAVSPLGDKYSELIANGIKEEDWLHLTYQDTNKLGAMTVGGESTWPKVIMSWEGTVQDVITLAHELGHALHLKLAQESQRKTPLISLFSLFFSEVISALHEKLVIEELSRTITDDQQSTFLKIDHFEQKVFKLGLLSLFEEEFSNWADHGKFFTGPDLCQAYGKLMENFFGKMKRIEWETIESVEWSRHLHFYRPFYLSQYVISTVLAYALFKKYQKNFEQLGETLMELMGKGSESTTKIFLERFEFKVNMVDEVFQDYRSCM